MDVRRYEVFQRAVELGSFSKAGERLGYTQPAVSRMVSALEDELGLALLARSRAGVELTPEGRRLYPYIEHVVLCEQALRGAVDEIKGLVMGTVRVGSITCVSNGWLPGLIDGFERLHPGVKFEVRQGSYALVADWVKTGVVDFGFVNARAAEGLETLPVKRSDLCAVLPRGHRLASYDEVPLAQMAEEPFILLGQGGYSEALEAFERIGVTPDVRYTVADAFAVKAMVERGLGVSILAEMLLAHDGYAVERRPLDPAVERTLCVAYRDWNALPVAAKSFIDYLREHVAELL